MTGGVSFVPVERSEIVVMFVRTEADLAKMQLAWAALEELVGLRGRKFFGAFYPSTEEYRVCVLVREGDDPDVLGLESGTLPGGKYLRARLRGDPPGLYEQIPPTFTALVEAASPDPTRPSIEVYRRHDEIDLLLPIGAPQAAGSA